MNVRSLVRLVTVLGFVVPCGLAALPTEAAACGESISFEVDPKVMLLSQAETSLKGGQARAAAVNALNAFPKLKSAPEGDPMLSRAQRIVALAVVRTEGFLSAGEVFKASTADERRANLEWAVGILRRINVEKKNTPAVETELGEALSKLPETRGEALTVLDKLARKDLITSAQGWAALAKLRRAAGDQEGEAAAQKRYEALARTGKKAPAEAAPAAAPAKPRLPTSATLST